MNIFNKAFAALIVTAALTFTASAEEDPYWDQFTTPKNYSSALYRIGFTSYYGVNLGDEDLNENYNHKAGVFLDWMYARFRTTEGNGLDLYARFTERFFKLDEDKAEENYKARKADILLLSIDPGVRYVRRDYFFPDRLSWYIMGAPRLLYTREMGINEGYESRNFFSLGIIAGAGMEISLGYRYGLFLEYNYGYVPVGDEDTNVEGHQVYAGFSWKTKIQKQYSE